VQGTIDLRRALEQTLRFDVEELCKPSLRKSLPRESDPTALAFFAQVLHRWSTSRIQVRPRRVYYSAALRQNPLLAKFQERIEEIAELLRNGDEALHNPDKHYFSKDYYKAIHGDGKGGVKVKYDKLLQEWQIYHFHIGKESAVEELLYAIVLEDAVLMIDLFGHGLDFADAKVLHAAKREWPQIFEGVGLRGIQGSKHPPEVIQRFRENGVNYFLDIDGTALTPHTTSILGGFPVLVRLALDRFLALAAEIQESLEHPSSPDIMSIAQSFGVEPKDLRLTVLPDRRNFFGFVIIEDEPTGKKAKFVHECLIFPWRAPRSQEMAKALTVAGEEGP